MMQVFFYLFFPALSAVAKNAVEGTLNNKCLIKKIEDILVPISSA